MTKIHAIKLVLFADYFQFHIQDETAKGDLGPKWTAKAVELLLATTDGIIGVGTVRNSDVPVTIQVFDKEPEFLADQESIFSQINECDLEVKSGRILVAGCTDYFPDAKRIELINGIYRVRIYYGNLEKISKDGLTGDDFYELHLWKTDITQNLKIIKTRTPARPRFLQSLASGE